MSARKSPPRYQIQTATRWLPSETRINGGNQNIKEVYVKELTADRKNGKGHNLLKDPRHSLHTFGAFDLVYNLNYADSCFRVPLTVLMSNRCHRKVLLCCSYI